jgi:nucleoside-diphosphate-sugar epimerase
VDLTVAVTGPTGDIGRATIRALEREPSVGRIVGMARRPFDPAVHGWERTEYLRGDVLDRVSVGHLVEGADVVIHLAFIIFGGHDETQRINLKGSRNVFEAAVAARATRLVYTSSVAAYGFHDENPQPLTEEIEPRGSEHFYYSAQKAELESVLWETVDRSGTDAYVFRPCVVAGEDALTLVEQLGTGGPFAPLRRLIDALPGMPILLPDPGVPLQLVHHDDVARAITAAALGKGEPGVYNLAAPGTITSADLAQAVGYRRVPVPGIAVKATAAALSVVPFVPEQMQWMRAFTIPVVMDCSKAAQQLEWEPHYDTSETLRDTIDGARIRGLLRL